jgi:hypothetical protein
MVVMNGDRVRRAQRVNLDRAHSPPSWLGGRRRQFADEMAGRQEGRCEIGAPAVAAGPAGEELREVSKYGNAKQRAKKARSLAAMMPCEGQK